MASYIQRTPVVSSTTSLFTPKRQSPTGHLKALRGPNTAANTTAYLSPGLHNVPDAWIRFLRSQAYLFVDEFGEVKNQKLLMGKSVQERKEIKEWAKFVKKNARTFIMKIYDDQVASKRAEHLRELAEGAKNAAIAAWSAHCQEESQKGDYAVDDYYEDYEESAEPRGNCHGEWAEEYAESMGLLCRSLEYWSEDFEESDKPVYSGVEDWSSDFEGSDEQLESAFQLKADKNVGAPSATLCSSSSCSEVSTEYDPIFDSDGDSSGDDGCMSMSSCSSPGKPTQHKECEDSTEAQSTTGHVDTAASHLPCVNQAALSKSEVQRERDSLECARIKRLHQAEDLLESGFPQEGHGYRLTACSWLPVKSQATPEPAKAADSVPQVPSLQLTNPEGEVFDLVERQAPLAGDFEEYAEQREAAQPRMMEQVKKYRARHETYSQYCKRLDAEKREKEHAKELAEEEEKLMRERELMEDLELMRQSPIMGEQMFKNDPTFTNQPTYMDDPTLASQLIYMSDPTFSSPPMSMGYPPTYTDQLMSMNYPPTYINHPMYMNDPTFTNQSVYMNGPTFTNEPIYMGYPPTFTNYNYNGNV